MARKIQFKRGLKKNLPTLSPGEMAFTTDEKSAYIGDGAENIRLLDQKDKGELTAQLADTAKKSEVYLKDKGININDFDETTRQTFLDQQGIDVNYVLGERNVKEENTTFFDYTVGKNLFNPSDPEIVNDAWMGIDGTVTTGTDDRFITGFIEVPEGKQLVGSYNSNGNRVSTEVFRFITVFDENKNPISAEGIKTASPYYRNNTSPGKKYVKLTIQDTKNVDLQIELTNIGASLTTYEPYKRKYYMPILKNELATIDPSKNPIKEEQTTFFKQKISRNLYNPNDPDFINGYILTVTTGAASTVSPTRAITGYIPIEYGKELAGSFLSGGTRIHSNVFRNFAVYDANKNIIPGEGNPNNGHYYRNNVSLGLKYVRFSIYIDGTTPDLMIYVRDIGSSESPPYEPYYKTWAVPYAEAILDTGASNKSGYKNKNGDSLGDSITNANQYQPLIKSYFSLNKYSNHGVSGSRVTGSGIDAMCNDARINALDSDLDFVTFMGGTNDWANSVPLGDISSISVWDFYGAVKIVAEKLITRFPTKRIIFMTTPYGKHPNRTDPSTGTAWEDTEGHRNLLGLTTKDYGNIIIEVARMYGIPCIDIYGTAGMNRLNTSSYFTGTDYLHPNASGHKRIADVLIGKLKEIEPVS